MADELLLRRRLTAQLLAGPPARDAVTVTRRLLGIQAQDPRAARLAIRARTRGVAGADVDRALTDDRSLVLTWCNRGTLHLFASGDYPLLQSLTTPPLRTGSDRRLAQEGVGPNMAARGVRVIERALLDAGPLPRATLRERLAQAGVRVAGQALVHLLYRASLDGVVVRGPVVDGEHAYALVGDWLPDAAAGLRRVRGDRDRALAELARRYLAGHGPASERDLARWAGIAVRDARAGLAAIGNELRDAPNGLVDLAARPRRGRVGPLPAPRLLGAFEPVLMGWTSRAAVLGEHADAIVTGGIFRGFGMVAGIAAARWRFVGEGIAVQPLEQLDGAAVNALERDGRAVLRFLGRCGRVEWEISATPAPASPRSLGR